MTNNMWEKEIEKRMTGTPAEKCYNAWSGDRPAPKTVYESQNAAAVVAALRQVKDNAFWRAILEEERRFSSENKQKNIRFIL